MSASLEDMTVDQLNDQLRDLSAQRQVIRAKAMAVMAVRNAKLRAEAADAHLAKLKMSDDELAQHIAKRQRMKASIVEANPAVQSPSVSAN